MVFELLTGDYLFDPQNGAKYDKDDDHVAQIIELLGEFPRQIALGGRYSAEIFSRRGELRRIHKLRYWPLPDVLKEKYGLPAEKSNMLASFLLPMLDVDASKRIMAKTALKHEWLADVGDDGHIKVDEALAYEFNDKMSTGESTTTKSSSPDSSDISIEEVLAPIKKSASQPSAHMSPSQPHRTGTSLEERNEHSPFKNIPNGGGLELTA